MPASQAILIVLTLSFNPWAHAETTRERTLPVTSTAGFAKEFAGGTCEFKVEAQGRTAILLTVTVNGQMARSRQVPRSAYPLRAGWTAVTADAEYVETHMAYDGNVLTITDVEKGDGRDLGTTEISIDPQPYDPSSIQLRRYQGAVAEPGAERMRVTCDPRAT